MKVSILCPEHGLQESNPNTEHAIACEKCFPTIKKCNHSSYPCFSSGMCKVKPKKNAR